MKDFLLFRKLITPTLIQIVFWGAVILSLYIGITDIIHKLYFTATQVLVGGLLVARVTTEVLILAFRINDNLTEMNRKLTR